MAIRAPDGANKAGSHWRSADGSGVDSDPGRCSPEHHCHHREDNNHQGMEEYGQWLISQKKQ